MHIDIRASALQGQVVQTGMAGWSMPKIVPPGDWCYLVGGSSSTFFTRRVGDREHDRKATAPIEATTVDKWQRAGFRVMQRRTRTRTACKIH